MRTERTNTTSLINALVTQLSGKHLNCLELNWIQLDLSCINCMVLDYSFQVFSFSASRGSTIHTQTDKEALVLMIHRSCLLSEVLQHHSRRDNSTLLVMHCVGHYNVCFFFRSYLIWFPLLQFSKQSPEEKKWFLE